MDRKSQKALALLYLASKPLRNAANSSGVSTEFATEPTRQIWTFCLNFVAKLFSPKLNFLPSTKKTTEYSFELFFSTNKFVFHFCCLCLFCYNAGQHAISRRNTRDSAQDSIQCRKCIGIPVVRTDGRTDGCTDGRSRDYYVTTKIFWLDRLPNFLSNGAPLTR